MTDGATASKISGCSKRPDFSPAQPRRAKTRRSAGKAAASEEARRYGPHFVGPFALAIGLGEWKSPSRASDFRETLVEPLSDARTPLADFFSILLVPRGVVLVLTKSTQRLIRHACLVTLLLVTIAAVAQPVHAAGGGQTKFPRIPTQFIAALGDPGATSGSGAQSWGLWPLDPGPRGVELNSYKRLKETGGVAPARWKFDDTDWWLEEHGLIMEQPTVPLPPGKYLVTGNRDVTAVLTIHPADKNGNSRWELDQGARLYDVTHLACRSARYTPAMVGGSCSPANAQKTAFPVSPGGVMPPVAGCTKQDYAVLIVRGVGVED